MLHIPSNHTIPHSPIEKVPTELWSMIFIRLVPTGYPPDSWSKSGYDPEDGIKDPRLTPLLISSVCKVWRNIAYGTPDIWTTCWLNYQHPEINTIWLSRSGTRPLHLYGIPNEYPMEDTRWKAFFLSIIPFQARWKSFQLEADCGSVGQMSITPVFDCPMLETAKFKYLTPAWMEKLLPNCPRLQHLHLSGFRLGTPLRFVALNLPHLSVLVITREILAEDSIILLSSLPQLWQFTAAIDEDGATEIDLPPCTHQNLTSLHLNGDCGPECILRWLTLPALRIFHCDVDSYELDWDIIHQFVARSNCTITDLCITDCEFSDRRLVANLKIGSLGRGLESLEVLSRAISPQLVDLLQLDLTQPNRHFPHLTKLIFCDTYFDLVSEGAVADMIISRCTPMICSCVDCSGNDSKGVLMNRLVRLEHATVVFLDLKPHALDIARLTPLPEDRQESEEGAALVLNLRYNVARFGHRRRYFIKKSSLDIMLGQELLGL